MPENNGQQDNRSRLDLFEASMEHILNGHEMFRDEHKRLLRSQVLFQEALEKQKERIDGIGSKLAGLIDVVDRNSREFHERLTRLENRQ